jgi:hypothetical protein
MYMLIDLQLLVNEPEGSYAEVNYLTTERKSNHEVTACTCTPVPLSSDTIIVSVKNSITRGVDIMHEPVSSNKNHTHRFKSLHLAYRQNIKNHACRAQ